MYAGDSDYAIYEDLCHIIIVLAFKPISDHY